jgi:hypothetical protein
MLLTALVAAVAGGVVWVQSERQRTDEQAVATTGSAAPSAPSVVADYIAFAAAVQVPPGGGAIEPTAEGLRRLAGALGALGIGDPALHIDVRVAAEHLVLNPRSVDNARLVREHLIKVGADLPPGPDAERVATVARSLDPATPLPDQAERLAAFFHSSADALR